MSRYKGTFLFGASLEGGSTVPIDARQMVGTYADLTLPATWCFSPACSNMALYNGMMTVVAGGACSGIYWLCDASNYTSASSWIKTGGGSITGATNGLSLFNSGKAIGLGGSITSGTTLTLSVGSTLTFMDSRFASNQVGVTYAGDYSINYTARSLVDAGYVTGKSNTVNVYCQAVTGSYTANTCSDFIGAMSGSSIYMPASPKPCQRVTVTDISGHALDCMIIVHGNGKCIIGADCATVNTDYGSVTLVNNGSFWSATAFIN